MSEDSAAPIILEATDDQLHLISMAASILGVDVGNFLIGCALEQALSTIDSTDSLQLSAAGQKYFADLISNPPEPRQQKS